MTRKSSTTVERGAEILLAIGNASANGLKLAEISETVGYAKSAVHRALTGLLEYGFVEQTAPRGRYRLGPTIYGLSAKSHSAREIVTRVRPILIEISQKTEGSSYLLVRAGADSLCIDYEEGRQPINPLIGGIGGRIPLGVGAASICMLSGMEVLSRKALLDANRNRLGNYRTMSQVHEAIEFAMENGYSYFENYGYLNMVNIAVPLPNKFSPSAAISVIVAMGPGYDRARIVDIMRSSISGLA